jgi:hypothetical protein
MLLLPFALPSLILKYLRAHRLLRLLRKGCLCHSGIACLLIGPVLGLLLLGRSQLVLLGPPRWRLLLLLGESQCGYCSDDDQ